MDSVKIMLMFTFISVLTSTVTVFAQEGTCKACNCQFSNVQGLTRLIESKITAALTNACVSGVTYTRWGKSSCPSSTGAQLVYSGRAGGTSWSNQGGAAEKICLPDNPDYTNDTFGTVGTNVVSGAEYEFHGSLHSSLSQHNAPCALCYVPTRATAIMVPAKTACPSSSWTREYYGYLTTEHRNTRRSSYTCLDINPEVVGGTNNSTNPSLLYFSSTDCNGLSCPPYQTNRVLSCAVCTK